LERSSRNTTTVMSEQMTKTPSNEPVQRRALDTEMLTTNFGWESACKLLRMFADSTPTILAKLATAIGNKDLDTSKATTHELKGYCATISMHDMAALSKQIGEATRNQEWAEAHQLYEQLVDAFEDARREIETLTMTTTTSS
jgi:HPt (histidine-containing phosphotransfer) domain-containing protein